LQFYWLSGIVEKIYDIYMENHICNCKNSRRAVQQLEKLNALLWDECVRENEKESQAYNKFWSTIKICSMISNFKKPDFM